MGVASHRALGLLAAAGSLLGLALPACVRRRSSRDRTGRSSSRAAAAATCRATTTRRHAIFVADYPFGTPVQVTSTPAGRTSSTVTRTGRPITRRSSTPPGSRSMRRHLRALHQGSRDGQRDEFVAPAAGQDRPTWSPDGTQIAYGSGGNLYVKDVDAGVAAPAGHERRPTTSAPCGARTATRSTSTAGRSTTARPARRQGHLQAQPGVARRPPPTVVVTTVDIDDWQAGVSPDGRRLCFRAGRRTTAPNLYDRERRPGSSPRRRSRLTTAISGDSTACGRRTARRCSTPRGVRRRRPRTARPDAGDPSAAERRSTSTSTSTATPTGRRTSRPPATTRPSSVDRQRVRVDRALVHRPGRGLRGRAADARSRSDSDALEIVDAAEARQHRRARRAARCIYTPTKDFTGTDTFTYRATTRSSDSAPATVDDPGHGPRAGGRRWLDTTAPVVSSITLSRKRWRRGSALPAAAARAKVGTTIGFGLDEAGTATDRVRQRAKPGTARRRAGASKPTRANRSRAALHAVRARRAASRSPRSWAPTSVRFQGRLSAAHAASRWAATASSSRVTDAAGNASQATPPAPPSGSSGDEREGPSCVPRSPRSRRCSWSRPRAPRPRPSAAGSTTIRRRAAASDRQRLHARAVHRPDRPERRSGLQRLARQRRHHEVPRPRPTPSTSRARVTLRVGDIIRPNPMDQTTALATVDRHGPDRADPARATIPRRRCGEFDAQLPIKQGQHLALDPSATVNAVYASSGRQVHATASSRRSSRARARAARPTSTEELLVQATIEPDADGDGFGDETQDQCPTQAGTHGPCVSNPPPPVALTLSGGCAAPANDRVHAVARTQPCA